MEVYCWPEIWLLSGDSVFACSVREILLKCFIYLLPVGFSFTQLIIVCVMAAVSVSFMELRFRGIMIEIVG